jgi:hypothetical protein
LPRRLAHALPLWSDDRATKVAFGLGLAGLPACGKNRYTDISHPWVDILPEREHTLGEMSTQGENRSQSDFSAELQSHLALEMDRLRAEGFTEEEARRLALKSFGNVTQSEERFYESKRFLWLDHLARDAGYALRRLTKDRAFTLVAERHSH